MPDQWSPSWSNAVFSLEERDRRWSKVRRLMARDGVHVIVCLPCTNNHDRGQQDARYLTQLGENSDETTVAFPIEGEVTAWHSRGGVWPSSNWLSDIRAARRGMGGQTVADYLMESGFERGVIAVAGLTSTLLAHVRAAEGEANWRSVEIIRNSFPTARVVSATEILGEARYQKSEEEIEFIQKGVEVAEATMDAVLEHARAGVPEREVFGHMMYANARAGGSFPPMFGWISGPLGNAYHRLEQPPFRRFEAGDVLITEIEGRWGGYIGQIDQCFSLGPAPEDLKDGVRLACESFDRVFAILKTGVTVEELLRAGQVTGMAGRGVASLTMHGRGTGDDGPLVTTHRSRQLLETELKEGCVMIIKPSTHVEGKPDYGRWGDSVVIRRDRAERLGTRPQVLHELV